MIILTLCLLVSPAAVYAFAWQALQGFQGWGFSNVRGISFEKDGATIYRLTTGDFFISTSLETVPSYSFVQAHFSTLSIDSIVTCALLSSGRVVVSRDIPLFSGRTWKECVFDFSGAATGIPINGIAFIFRNCDSVRIRDLTATGPSFSEVWALQGFTAHNVNLLHPFVLYGHSLNLWLYALIAASGVCITGFFLLKRRKGAFILIGGIFVICYLAVDVREIYEEINIVKTTMGDYLNAPLREKRYHWDDYIVQFSNLINETATVADNPMNFWGEGSRYLYMRYLLYPLRIQQGSATLSKVNVFYAGDTFLLHGNRLFEGDKVVSESGRGIPFARESFIYLTR